MPDSIHALAGIAGLVAASWALSENRREVPWRAVLTGLALQLGLAAVFLKIGTVKTAFLKLNDALLVLEQATQAGTSLVFGYLGRPDEKPTLGTCFTCTLGCWSAPRS